MKGCDITNKDSFIRGCKYRFAFYGGLIAFGFALATIVNG